MEIFFDQKHLGFLHTGDTNFIESEELVDEAELIVNFVVLLAHEDGQLRN